MHRLVQIFTLVTAIMLLQGCALLNSTDRLWEGETPFFNRTTIVYGVDVDVDGGWVLSGVHWQFRTFGMSIDEYSIEKQNITGNCWRYNKANVLVSVDDPLPQYFAFDVPAGYYVHSPFNNPRIEPSVAFVAPKGRVIYIGTFVYSKNRSIKLHRDLEKDKRGIFSALPRLPKNIELAETVPVKPPYFFLCGP